MKPEKIIEALRPEYDCRIIDVTHLGGPDDLILIAKCKTFNTSAGPYIHKLKLSSRLLTDTAAGAVLTIRTALLIRTRLQLKALITNRRGITLIEDEPTPLEDSEIEKAGT